jgi:hypothetical protein
MITGDDLKAELIAKGWEQRPVDRLVEDFQVTSFWYNSDPAKLDIRLRIVEDLTEAGNDAKLFIHSYDRGWIPIRIEELDEEE